MEPNWVERSNREAAALLADTSGLGSESYNAIVSLLAIAYRKGAEDGLARGQEIALEILREGQES